MSKTKIKKQKYKKYQFFFPTGVLAVEASSIKEFRAKLTKWAKEYKIKLN